jgi:hypothetical protein
MGARRYRDRNGNVGIGFMIEWAGLQMASIAWETKPATRHTLDEFERGMVEDLGELVECVSDPENVNSKAYVDGMRKDFERLLQENERLKVILGSAPTVPEDQPSEAQPENSDPQPEKSEAQHIRDYLAANPEASNSQAIDHLATIGVNVHGSQIATQRKKIAKQ